MNLSRRDAIRTVALGTLATVAARNVSAQAPATSPAAEGPFTLPALAYSFDALEPHIDAQTMQIHHDKHHAAYVAKLNDAWRQMEWSGPPPTFQYLTDNWLRDEKFLAANPAIRNHGGGHANHTLFWASLSKDGGKAPTGDFATVIEKDFGSFDVLKEKLTKAAAGVFGSGWAWLTIAKGHTLQVETTPNQDTPITSGRTPLLGIDVWEHAYYLKYQNKRADYVAAIFNVIDWNVIAERHTKSFIG